MSQRLCSIVVALAVLWTAGPAFAQKKKGDDAGDEAKPAEADAPAEGEKAAEGEGAADVGPVVEPREAWEAPPKDEEKPKPEVAKPQKEMKVGDGKPITAGLLLGWGFKTDRAVGQLGADPYTLGIGLRGGYGLDFGLYLGGYFVYYIGSSRSGMSSATATMGETHANYILFGAEVGYDWWVGDAIVRPSLGLGPALGITDNESVNVTGGSTVLGAFALHPGMSVIIPFEDWFIGGDMRANVVTGDGLSGIAIYANGGLRFAD
jgi:hypothetical protein